MKTSKIVQAVLAGLIVAFCSGFNKAVADAGTSPELTAQLPTEQVAKETNLQKKWVLFKGS